MYACGIELLYSIIINFTAAYFIIIHFCFIDCNDPYYNMIIYSPRIFRLILFAIAIVIIIINKGK